MLDAQDLALAATAAAYAAILDGIKDDHLEPDWTWAEVTLGTMMCLGAAATRVRTESAPDWRAYERATWRAFAIGGGPVIVWQIGRAIWRHLQACERDRRNAHERAEALAQKSAGRTR